MLGEPSPEFCQRVSLLSLAPYSSTHCCRADEYTKLGYLACILERVSNGSARLEEPTESRANEARLSPIPYHALPAVWPFYDEDFAREWDLSSSSRRLKKGIFKPCQCNVCFQGVRLRTRVILQI